MKISLLGNGWVFFFLLATVFASTSTSAHSALINIAITRQVQQEPITGTVVDQSGPLVGVTVRDSKSNKVTVTAPDGNFTIEATLGATLIFELAGYTPQQLLLTTPEAGTITMAADPTVLSEVIVNAGYYSVARRESTGNIARITAKEITTQPVTNVLGTLQGRMPGVSVSQTTGVAGGGFDIQIRGINSLRGDGNSPLYVIDGVPYAAQQLGHQASTGVLPTPASPLNSINPADIESIEVLKDADATAIYGSRGANGVVLVTTKKGRAGATRYQASITQGLAEVPHFMKMMDTRQYLAMRAEAYTNDNIANYPASAYDINGTWDPQRYTDWQKELLGGTAHYTDVAASASGGSQGTQFFLGANYHKETTVFPGDFGYGKGTFRAAVNHSSEDGKFKADFTAGYTAQDNDQPAADLTRVALNLAPNAPALYNSDGSLNWEGSTWENPLAALNGKYSTNTYDLIANTVLTYSVFRDFTAKISLGYTTTQHQETRTQPSTIYDPAYQIGSEYSILNQNNTQRHSWIVEPQLSYRKNLGLLSVNALVGTTFQRQSSLQLAQEGYGFTSNSLIYNLDAANALAVVTHNDAIYKYYATYARVNFSWDGTYIVNLTGRRDASSRFGPGKQFANFGAVGAGWIFTRSGLLEDNPILSFGKLRASYGSSGNDQIGDYQYLDTYTSSGTVYGGVVGLTPSRLYNPNFGWESNTKLEIGLEAGLLDDRVNISASWFSNRSSSQLVGVPLPGTTGFPSIQSNLDATVRNTGLELALTSGIFKRDNFSWSASFNISFLKNELLRFPGLESSTYRNQYSIGQPLNIRKVYHYTGLDPQTGLYTFEDVNADGRYTAEDRQSVVDFNPEFFGGLLNDFRYKQWQLSFHLQFVKQQNYSPEYVSGIPGRMGNQPEIIAAHWQSPGDTGPFQQYTSGVNAQAYDAYERYRDSDANTADTSFLRLKNVSLTYNIPKAWLKNVECAFTLTGQNLLTVTPYKGADPEFRYVGYLPPLRVMTAGLQLNF